METRYAPDDVIIQRAENSNGVTENGSMETPVIPISKMHQHTNSQNTLNQTEKVSPIMYQLQS